VLSSRPVHPRHRLQKGVRGVSLPRLYGKTEVRLVVPGLPTRGSVRIRLDRKTRTKCPLGKVECSVNGNTVAHFNCKEVIEYLSIKLGCQQSTSAAHTGDL